VCVSVHACLLVTNMSLREPTRMSFGVWIHGGARVLWLEGALFRSYLWLSSRVVSVLDLGAEGPGTNRSRDAVG